MQLAMRETEVFLAAVGEGRGQPQRALDLPRCSSSHALHSSALKLRAIGSCSLFDPGLGATLPPVPHRPPAVAQRLLSTLLPSSAHAIHPTAAFDRGAPQQTPQHPLVSITSPSSRRFTGSPKLLIHRDHVSIHKLEAPTSYRGAAFHLSLPPSRSIIYTLNLFPLPSTSIIDWQQSSVSSRSSPDIPKARCQQCQLEAWLFSTLLLYSHFINGVGTVTLPFWGPGHQESDSVLVEQ